MKIQNHFDYIQKCVDNGITSFSLIYENLKNEIQEINQQLSSVEHLRMQRNDLLKIENTLSSMLRSDSVEDKFEDSSNEMISIREVIYEVLSEEDSISNRDIITRVCDKNNSFYGMDAKIIRCIKYMADMSIIDKNSDRLIIKGDNWLKFRS